MQNQNHYNTTEERFDLVFSEPTARLRERSPQFWRRVVSEAGAKILSRREDEGVDSYVLSESSLFVFDRRVVMITCGSSDLLSGALDLLWRLSDEPLARFVYQRRGLPEPNPREFRQRLARIRSEAGDRLGAAVVAGDTVLFHPPPHKPRLAGGRACVQVLMRKLCPRVEAVFRASPSRQREVAIEKLGLGQLLKGFKAHDHHFSPVGYSMNATSASEYFTLHVSPEGPSSFASFEFDGKCRAEVGHAVQKVLGLFSPREYRVEALHGGQALNLPVFDANARWETQALGQFDSKSALVTERSASASA